MTQEWLEQAERQERIKFLYYVVKMPERVRCNRPKAMAELTDLLAVEGFAPGARWHPEDEEEP